MLNENAPNIYNLVVNIQQYILSTSTLHLTVHNLVEQPNLFEENNNLKIIWVIR